MDPTTVEGREGQDPRTDPIRSAVRAGFVIRKPWEQNRLVFVKVQALKKNNKKFQGDVIILNSNLKVAMWKPKF